MNAFKRELVLLFDQDRCFCLRDWVCVMAWSLRQKKKKKAVGEDDDRGGEMKERNSIIVTDKCVSKQYVCVCVNAFKCELVLLFDQDRYFCLRSWVCVMAWS